MSRGGKPVESVYKQGDKKRREESKRYDEHHSVNRLFCGIPCHEIKYTVKWG